MRATQFRSDEDGEDYRVNVDNRGHLSISDNWRVSDAMFDDVIRPNINNGVIEVKRGHMRELRGGLPSIADLNQIKMEIHFLNNKEALLPLQDRVEFHEQMQSAENQLRLIRAELADPMSRLHPQPDDFKEQVARDWRKLNASLIRAEAFYD